MRRIEFSLGDYDKQPMVVQAIEIDFDTTGQVRVTLDVAEVVDLRWNALDGRWEWYEDGEWHYA